MAQRYFSSRFFVRLLVLSCIMGICPLVVLGYLSYEKSSSIIQDEVGSSNQLILQQNKARVEYVLKTVDTLTTQLISAPVTTNRKSMQSVMRLPYNYENFKIFESLRTRLIQIQVYELGVQDVNLISFDQGWLIDKGLVYSLSSLNADLKQDNMLIRLGARLDGYGKLDTTSFWTLEPSMDDSSEYILKLVKHIPIHSNQPTGLLSVNVPITEISKLLTQNRRLGTTFIVDSIGIVISHPDADHIGSSIADQAYIQDIQTREAGEAFFTFYDEHEQEYAVTYQRSAYNDWLYVSLTPMKVIMAESSDIKWYTLVVAAFIVGLVVLISIFVSRKMYTPVLGMMRTQHHMAHQIQGLNRQVHEYFVTKLLIGEHNALETKEKLKDYGYDPQWKYLSVLAIRIDTLEHTHYVERDKDLLVFAIHNMVEEIVSSEHRLSPIVIHQSVAVVVGDAANDAAAYREKIYAVAKEIQSKVKVFLHLKISIGISRSYTDFSHVPEAYKESMDALTYRVRLGHESILFMDEVHPKEKNQYHYPREIERNLFEAIKQLHMGQAKACLSQLMASIFNRHMSHLESEVLLGRLFHHLTGMIIDEGGTMEEVYSNEVPAMTEARQLHSAEEIESWFLQNVMAPMMTWLEKKRNAREIHISEEIMKMIREEYDQDLTIEKCAARLNYHPNYVSRVFKKEMGHSFSNVLSQYRVDVAKKWLRETDYKISEIAEKLQYNHASNFIRNFKKSEGVTPNQYRDQFQ